MVGKDHGDREEGVECNDIFLVKIIRRLPPTAGRGKVYRPENTTFQTLEQMTPLQRTNFRPFVESVDVAAI